MDDIIRQWYEMSIGSNDRAKGSLVSESILDFRKKTKNPAIWLDEDHIRPELVQKIIGMYDRVFREFGVDWNSVKSIYVTGSNTGRYWSEGSDLDTAALLDLDDEEIKNIVDSLYEKYGDIHFFIRAEENGVEIWSGLLNLFFIRYDEKNKYPISLDGIHEIYPVERPVQKRSPKIEIDPMVFEAVLGWVRKVESDLDELRRDISDFMFYSEGLLLADKISVEKEEIKSKAEMKFKEIMYDISSIKQTMSIIKNMRTENHKKLSDDYAGRDIPDSLKIDYKTMSRFDGMIVAKLLDRYGCSKIAGDVLVTYAKNVDEETKKLKCDMHDMVRQLADIWKKR